MTVLGLLTGMVQAYIFTILAAVYIAAATRTRRRQAQASPRAGGLTLARCTTDQHFEGPSWTLSP